MTTYIADTNLFLRFVLKDNPSLHKKAEAYFYSVKTGAIRLVFLREVIAEIIFVLQKLYKISRRDIVASVSSLLNMPSVDVERPEVISSALTIYEKQNISYVDAIILAESKSRSVSVASFDRKVEKLSS